MIRITKENFNLSQICKSGQCFRMTEESGNTYNVIAGGRYLTVEQREAECIFYCGEPEFEEFWKNYFDLDGDYAAYIGQIDEADTYLASAVRFGSGIRILRQDLWEMIVTFLISQQNNITRIRKCIQNICRQYGDERINAKGEVYYTFPQPASLAGLAEDALMECNLGYRSKYVVRSARSVVSGETDLNKIRALPYPEAKAELLKLYGVGEKVADCICLFALHHLQAFPVDTHIKQAFARHYRDGFPDSLYNGYQGVVQQYIFYYELFGAEEQPIMDIIIKKMESEDEIKGKAYVHWKSWQESYPGLVDESYLSNLTLEKCTDIAYRFLDNIIVAKDNDKTVGFVAYGGYRDDTMTETGEIYAIYILKEYYGKKAGYSLMNAAMEKLSEYKRIAVWVLQGNERAIRFYERYGFVFDGTKEHIMLGTENTELRMIYTC